MKIAIVSIWPLSQDAIGGTEKFIKELGWGLQSSGYEVHCVSPANTRKYYGITHRQLFCDLPEINEFILRSYVAKNGLAHFLEKIKKQIKQLCEKEKYTGVVFNSPIVACNLDIRSILVIHDDPIAMENYFGRPITREIMHYMRGLRDCKVVVPSYYCRNLFGKILRVPIVVIPHALPNNSKIITRPHRSSFSRRVVIPSRLEPNQKGQDMAIWAMSSVLKAGNKGTLIIAGATSYYLSQQKKLGILARKLGVNVKFCQTKRIETLLLQSDIALVPSRYESFGYAAQEAIRFAPLVLLSDIPPFKEISRGAKNVSFFKSGSVSDLSSKLLKLWAKKAGTTTVSSSWLKRYEYNSWIQKYRKLLV